MRAPGSEDFAGMPLFDRDVKARLQIPINRGEGNSNVERDAVASGQDGLGIGADLVGDLAGAAESTVAADYNQVDPAPLHEVAGGAVGDDLVGDALLGQFPRRQGRALGAWTGFVAEDMILLTL